MARTLQPIVRRFISFWEEAVAAVEYSQRLLTSSEVVEGVEEEAQLDLLRRLGYPLVQGFLFCRPSPADSLKNLLERGRAALPGFP